jgi:hypothetical protein
MSGAINVIGVALLFGLVFGVPPLAIFFLFRLRKGARSWGRQIVFGLSGAALLAWVGMVVGYLMRLGPGQSGILAQGFSPEGREFCVVQKFQDFVEGYRAAFYLRDAAGAWQWVYLAHDDNTWKPTTVEFTPTSVRISRRGVVQREIPRRGETIEQGLDGARENRPAQLSAAELAAGYQHGFR